jgi:hypothetical protein
MSRVRMLVVAGTKEQMLKAGLLAMGTQHIEDFNPGADQGNHRSQIMAEAACMATMQGDGIGRTSEDTTTQEHSSMPL